MMTPTITLREAAKLLNYKTTRSLKSWCHKAGVKIYSDKGGRKYLILSLLMDAHLKEFKGDLQMQFGSKWVDFFKMYMGETTTGIVDMENEKNNMPHTRDMYKPTGDHEKNFLARLLTKSSPELR